MAATNGQSDRDRVLAATDLVAVVSEQVRLQPKGSEFIGVCPFHDDSRPSMYVVPAKNFYHCFACGAHGNAIDFLINLHRMEFREALEALASRAGIELTGNRQADSGASDRRAQLFRANELAARFFSRVLREGDDPNGRETLAERGISNESIERFGIGMAPKNWDDLLKRVREFANERTDVPSPKIFEDAGLLRMSKRGELIDYFRNRLIFPIRDELGRPIAFGARRIDPDDEPKYLNSCETEIFSKSSTLFGLDLAKKAMTRTRTAIVCEGYTDVIALHAAGFENAVAALGTALTREHAKRLSRFCDNIILLFDGDEAGRRAADRGIEVFFGAPVDVRLCSLPEGMDPDEILQQPDGAERFQAALDGAVDALQSLIQGFSRSLEAADGITARSRVVEQALSRLSSLGMDDLSVVRRRLVVDAIAGSLGLSSAELDHMATPKGRMAAPPVEPPPMEDQNLPEEPLVRAEMARRTAEERLLQLVLADPELAHCPISLDGEEPATVLDRYPPDRFEDPVCRLAWIPVHARADHGMIPDGPDLIAEVASEEAGCLASSLFVQGLRELGRSETPARELLESAAREFEAVIARQHRRIARSEATGRQINDLHDAARAIEALRAAGADPAAIPRTHRDLPHQEDGDRRT